MTFWSFANVRKIVGGRWIHRFDQEPIAIPSGASPVSTDTRNTLPGQVFFALQGDRFDAHKFLGEAVARGASVLVVQNESAIPIGIGIPVLAVADTEDALLVLGAAYRRQVLCNARVVAVTGSNGKTTTCGLVRDVAATALRTHASPKSFNNRIGVPLTLLAAPEDIECVVCEVGANAPGEIAELTSAIAPDIAVITSIGRAHLAGFGDANVVAKEKASLLAGVPPGGVAILPADAPMETHRTMRDSVPNGVQTQWFGTKEGAHIQVRESSHRAHGLRVGLADGCVFDLPLFGEHNATNAAAAVAVGRFLGIDDRAIAAGLAGAKPPAMRLSMRQVGSVVVLNDAYNANPDSMIAAVRTLASACSDAKRRVAVLGEMLELGDGAMEAHCEIAIAVAAAAAVELLVAVGPYASVMATAALQARSGMETYALPVADDAAISTIVDMLCPGDTVLLKASRGVRLERVEMAIVDRFGGSASCGAYGDQKPGEKKA